MVFNIHSALAAEPPFMYMKEVIALRFNELGDLQESLQTPFWQQDRHETTLQIERPRVTLYQWDSESRWNF